MQWGRSMSGDSLGARVVDSWPSFSAHVSASSVFVHDVGNSSRTLHGVAGLFASTSTNTNDKHGVHAGVVQSWVATGIRTPCLESRRDILVLHCIALHCAVRQPFPAACAAPCVYNLLFRLSLVPLNLNPSGSRPPTRKKAGQMTTTPPCPDSLHAHPPLPPRPRRLARPTKPRSGKAAADPGSETGMDQRPLARARNGAA